jgi:hypothetical protein
LQQHDPAYLLSHPTNLRELARLALKKRASGCRG